MPSQQVNERIREFPAHALRAVFAGIGQVLLVADKVRSRAMEQFAGPAASPAAPEVTAPPAEAPTAQPAPSPSPAKSGNVRVMPEADGDASATAAEAQPAATPEAVHPETATPESTIPDTTAPVVSAAAPAEPAAAQPPATEPVSVETVRVEPVTPAVDEAGPATPEAVPPPAPEAEAAGLPLHNYDELTVASLRARLRVLTSGQVRTLLDYERAHEARAAVITMFERRLVKLDEGES